MENTLLISLLIIGSSAVAQRTTTIDTLQELPREEAVISKKLLLERALSKTGNSTAKTNGVLLSL